MHKPLEKGLHSVQLPICLPHELLPWLQRHKLFPAIKKNELERWWKHAAKHDLSHASLSPEFEHHCLYIWGDDAQFNELGEKLICISVGHILDPRTFSMESCYPIFVLREETCQKHV